MACLSLSEQLDQEVYDNHITLVREPLPCMLRALYYKPAGSGGGYIALEDKSAAQKRSSAILASAKAAGAETVVTACPLCMYNLDANGGAEHVPVRYFTELLAEALGVREQEG